MPKSVSTERRLSEQEWADLPITFGAETMSTLVGCHQRYILNHAQELGGTKLAGRWVFSKPKVAAMLGL